MSTQVKGWMAVNPKKTGPAGTVTVKLAPVSVVRTRVPARGALAWFWMRSVPANALAARPVNVIRVLLLSSVAPTVPPSRSTRKTGFEPTEYAYPFPLTAIDVSVLKESGPLNGSSSVSARTLAWKAASVLYVPASALEGSSASAAAPSRATTDTRDDPERVRDESMQRLLENTINIETPRPARLPEPLARCKCNLHAAS